MTPADGELSTRTRRKPHFLFVVKLLVPIVLLYVIFRQIDVGLLCEHFKHVRATYFVAGMVGGVVSQVLVAAYRWKYMLDRGYSVRLPYTFLLRHYWSGMFLGYFVPAGIGVDAYRIAAVYRRVGKLGANLAVILGEKLFGVAGSVFAVLATYPAVVSGMQCSPKLIEGMNWIYLVAMVTIAAAIAVWFLVRGIWTGRADDSAPLPAGAGFYRAVRPLVRLAGKWSAELRSMTDGMASRLATRAECSSAGGRFETEYLPPKEDDPRARRLPGWRYVAVILLLTVLIRVLAAAAVYCFFMSLGHEVPITVTLFAFSMIFLVFMLPISFGSLGVREGAYIVFFGLFAVPREVALAASFLGLAALLATIGVGGLILLGSVAVSDSPGCSRKP